MKALVTGATGFVGSHLTEALRRRGDEVTILARSASKAAALAPLGVRVVAGDLADRAAVAEGLRDQDVVYHVAGLVAARSEAEFLAANRDGSRDLAEAAALAGVRRFVLVSSMAAAGPTIKGRPLRGDEAPRPVTAYGRSKLAGEQAVTATGLDWTIVRPPMVYGPRDHEVLKVFRLARLGLAPVLGDGGQELSAVHAADLAEALVAAGTHDVAVGRMYYACHPEVFTGAELSRAVGRAMGRTVALVRVPSSIGRGMLRLTGAAARLTGQATILTADKANEFYQPAWTADPSPLTRDTGWQARRDLRTGLDETYRWYREAGWL
ncbi:MAG TPA: NAD-dependent epimerase/dehydratase family protein [Gemmatimonadales bacterium]|nr:NAD-dependent epimerase/dehydratase family protein [Gemmatimonadales bacterium]